jgi:hypothetical protein
MDAWNQNRLTAKLGIDYPITREAGTTTLTRGFTGRLARHQESIAR